MRAAWVLMVWVAGCSCFESKPTAEVAPVLATPPSKPSSPGPVVAVSWEQQRLTPTRTDVVAVIEYGPLEAAHTVQLELPEALRVVRGRTFFTLDPTPERRTLREAFVLSTPALPAQDLTLVVTGPAATLRQAYRFGRR